MVTKIVSGRGVFGFTFIFTLGFLVDTLLNVFDISAILGFLHSG